MATKRLVEVFTAGCCLCDDAVKLVRELACPSCDVQVHDLTTDDGRNKAESYGVIAVPTVVVDGRIADCCARGRVDAAALRASGVGSPV